MKITRDVVTDLWPLYESGEASADTRALVDEYLAQDPEFARALREDDCARLLEPASIAPEPDHEMKTLARTKQTLLRREWPLFVAIVFSCQAFGRIVSDTSWDVSPRAFIYFAALAGVFWTIFLVRLARRLALKS